ncbi:GTP pyrophosphokinase [Natronospira proteinivora]|uniref:GTP pyrophosphokinase n=1 Tax=Natronospira proteinivora TaxID=1807133 RepID=A0ABT1G519_9GAMM|nr:GTP diphosphokinase [Natronospira proteinivora]MCP1726392.1 GTP pyrophosphokinase [Natronospira proteinivora]
MSQKELKKALAAAPRQATTSSTPAPDDPDRARALLERLAEPDSEALGRAQGIARIVSDLDMPAELECAALLFPAVDAGILSVEKLSGHFSPTVATLVDDMIHMPRFDDLGRADPGQILSRTQSEALRQMLLAMAQDIRVVVLRLADQLHAMRSLRHGDPHTQRVSAIATRELYAPLANRLGIWQLKWELEDLSLRFLEPRTYHRIAKLLRETRAEREAYITHLVELIRQELSAAGINGDVKGRPKHIYSIWKKMQRKGLSFENLFDVRAVRILVESVPQCYAVLGLIHGLWRHIPHEFDDYIANPKENNYQSLHTAVFGPDDKAVEVQIRTWDMHEHAELGVAAHWRYKEGGQRGDPALNERIAWLRRLLEPVDPDEGDHDLLDRFQSEVFEDRIYALTPSGDIVDLPPKATPVDFAYRIHTQVGHRCRGAKVDGRIVSLNHELKNGNRVEILTGKHARPSRDWLVPQLGYVASSRARAKIRHWFRQQNQENHLEQGRQILDREASRLGVELPDRKRLAREFKYQTIEELLTAIGRGDVTGDQIGNRLSRWLEPQDPTPETIRTRPSRASEGGVRVLGIGDLATTMARCCRPVPGDEIVGFITRGRGVSIHRRDCGNMLRLAEDQEERLIEVDWERDDGRGYAADIQVTAWDRQGLLRDITTLLGNDGVNITNIATQTDAKNHTARIRLTVELANRNQLSQTLQRLAQLANVTEAKRIKQ